MILVRVVVLPIWSAWVPHPGSSILALWRFVIQYGHLMTTCLIARFLYHQTEQVASYLALLDKPFRVALPPVKRAPGMSIYWVTPQRMRNSKTLVKMGHRTEFIYQTIGSHHFVVLPLVVCWDWTRKHTRPSLQINESRSLRQAYWGCVTLVTHNSHYSASTSDICRHCSMTFFMCLPLHVLLFLFDRHGRHNLFPSRHA